MNAYPRICDYLAEPVNIPLSVLVALTRHYYHMSAVSVDNPRSNFHRWYYILAIECERRGYLDRILARRRVFG